MHFDSFLLFIMLSVVEVKALLFSSVVKACTANKWGLKDHFYCVSACIRSPRGMQMINEVYLQTWKPQQYYCFVFEYFHSVCIHASGLHLTNFKVSSHPNIYWLLEQSQLTDQSVLWIDQRLTVDEDENNFLNAQALIFTFEIER